MAKIDKLDKKKQADILTAHMGLAAEPEKPEKGEGCLSSEELADMAANLCTPEQREKAMEHFSSCQACYDEWVSLCFSMMSMESGSSGKMPLVTIRNLGYVGSALAIAASVVLYINVSRDIDIQEVAPLPPSRDKAIIRTVKPSEQPKAKALRRPPEAVPAPSLGGESSAPARMERQEYSDSLEVQETMADQAVAEEGAVEDLSAGVQEQEEKSAGEISKWLIVVEYGCKTNNSNGPFWQSLYTEGQNLLSGVEAGEGDVLRQVLQLLPESDQVSDVTEQCGKILSLLAEQGKKQ